MVGKLLKYDLKNYFRVLVPMYLVVLSIALLNRITQMFESSSAVYNIVFISSCVLLGVACVVCSVMTTVMIIVVFYRNLFSREGYLSFTLPVTADDHLHAKMAGGLIVSFASLFVCLLGGVIATLGEVLAELLKAGAYLLKDLAMEVGAGNLICWTVEFALTLLLASVLTGMFYYLCICLGQRARKNRILAAFGVFFLFYIGGQILATVLSITVALAPDWFSALAAWLNAMGEGAVYLILGVSLVLTLGLCFACYAVNKHCMNKHLNLE